MRIVYRRQYNIGLLGIERLHPFDSRKYSRAYAVLNRRFGKQLRHLTLRPSSPVTRDELLAVHSAAYLKRLRNAAVVAEALELAPLKHAPSRVLDWAVLRPMRWATRGTLIAAEQALTQGLAVNLGGGYHHAKPGSGEGFCIYSDIALAIQWVRAAGRISADARVAYIDLDAHQGNGVCHAFHDDNRVYLFDMFNSQIYPLRDRKARERIDCAIPLSSGCGDDEYLGRLESRLPGFLDSLGKTQPVELAIYNAGTDVFAGDPLGQLKLSAEAIRTRDLRVVELLRKRRIPTVMLLSGGYTSRSHELVADSVARLIENHASF